ncbi:MAG TPA: 3,4-dehydroadipyl-CoA semialdehyde dehydrogenase [Nevskiaceae bacterium]|nr:3,4-dehydroadipyl-CoA semialdehyde dehydrogenase [Nevskiaceae bacterium]
MSELLPNYLAGRWQTGAGAGTTLTDPVTGAELVRVSRDGLDIATGFDFARHTGAPALHRLSYAERATLLARSVDVLKANRDAYYDIATANSGTVKNDSAIDIDGAIYTLAQYAKWGQPLTGHALLDGRRVALAKDGAFASQHVWVPVNGLALFINAFNFPAWGLWEKAGPALLSGVPVVVKPATVTAWLTQRMVADVVNAGIWPAGALSVLCGNAIGLLDALAPGDVLSFTGSHATASTIRRHPAISTGAVRANFEADSLNAALLMPDAEPGSPAFDLLTREVVREMTQKSGQKRTAIRRVLVPQAALGATLERLSEKLAKTTVGNPRDASVRMGALVSRAQYDNVQHGIAALGAEAEVVVDGRHTALVDADPQVAACLGPTLFALRTPAASAAAHVVHDREVFGPVATVLPYTDLAQARALIARGGGSLVASLYGDDSGSLADQALQLAQWHGRVHVVSPAVAQVQTGHGNVMPQSLHGGPGRAGGGHELGGLRALDFYHRRAAIQAAPDVLERLDAVTLPA